MGHPRDGRLRSHGCVLHMGRPTGAEKQDSQRRKPRDAHKFGIQGAPDGRPFSILRLRLSYRE
eukprot:767124-Amphidinium_carterae.3